MKTLSLERVIAIQVPQSAMQQALLLAIPKEGDFDRARLLVIALRHSGDHLLAEALWLRLSILRLLHDIDPTVLSSLASIDAASLAQVLVTAPIEIVDGRLSFDGDAIAIALRAAAEPVGHA